MKVQDYYMAALDEGYDSLKLVIEYLVKERKVLTMNDTKDKLEYYLQSKFHDKMNAYLLDYEKRRNT